MRALPPEIKTFKRLNKLKTLVWIRDSYICQYCGLDMRIPYYQYLSRIELGIHPKLHRRKHVGLTVDHVIPLSNGGTWTLDNLVTACSPCNREKGSKSLIEYNKKPNLYRRIIMWIIKNSSSSIDIP